MNAARRPQSLLRLAESHLDFARDEARRGYAKRDETLIRDSAEKTWLAVNEAVDHAMIRRGRAPPVGRDAHTARREFLEMVDRDLAKQLAYFAEALHGGEKEARRFARAGLGRGQTHRRRPSCALLPLGGR